MAIMACRLSCALGAGLLLPDFESVRPDRAIGMGSKLVTAGIKVTIDERVGGQEVLGLSGRCEPLHLLLLSSVALVVASAHASFRPDCSGIGFVGARRLEEIDAERCLARVVPRARQSL
jgi:hypothetical protein